MLKYLRIAVTALSLTACVMLIALWVRSYSRTEIVFRINKNLVSTTFGSTSGLIYFHRIDASGDGAPGDPFAAEESGWQYSSVPESPSRPLKFEWKSNARQLIIRAPYRYVAPIFAAI